MLIILWTNLLKMKQWVCWFGLYFYFVKVIQKNERIFAKEFCKKLWEKWYLEHPKLGWWDDLPINPATQCIILKIIGFLFSVSAWHTRGRAPSATFVFNHFTDIKSVGTELIWISYQRSRKSLYSTLVLQLYFTNFLFLYMMFVFQLAKRLILMHKIRTKDEEQVETWEDRLGRELNLVPGTGLARKGTCFICVFIFFIEGLFRVRTSDTQWLNP